ADPFAELEDGTEAPGAYPSLGENVTASDNVVKMRKREDKFVRIFHGLKTFEYDLALYSKNRVLMLKALTALHPQIAVKVTAEVEKGESDQAKAKALFSGMFERPRNNIQKGRFGQALAQVLAEEGADFEVPEYISSAIKHVCG